MKKTNQERLEDKCCIKRNRWVKKKKLQGRNKSSHDTVFGLANIPHLMWETPAGAGIRFAGHFKVLCAVAASSFSLLLSFKPCNLVKCVPSCPDT